MDIDSRLRVARGIAKTEILASIVVFQTLKRRGHPDTPPPLISDGWGGIDESLIEVYCQVPQHRGWGWSPPRKRARPGWQYLQMVKQRDDQGRLQGVKLRAIFGKKAKLLALLGCSTAYIERSHLTNRLFNGRQVLKTLAFSKDLTAYQVAAMWEDNYYNLVRPHKSLRVPRVAVGPQKWQRRIPAMAARLTDHIGTVKEFLTTLPLPRAINT